MNWTENPTTLRESISVEGIGRDFVDWYINGEVHHSEFENEENVRTFVLYLKKMGAKVTKEIEEIIQ